jgi:hypothetical protein
MTDLGQRLIRAASGKDNDLADVKVMLAELRKFTLRRYGKRCRDVEPGCRCCMMWTLYDLYKAMAT